MCGNTMCNRKQPQYDCNAKCDRNFDNDSKIVTVWGRWDQSQLQLLMCLVYHAMWLCRRFPMPWNIRCSMFVDLQFRCRWWSTFNVRWSSSLDVRCSFTLSARLLVIYGLSQSSVDFRCSSLFDVRSSDDLWSLSQYWFSWILWLVCHCTPLQPYRHPNLVWM